MLYVLGAPGSGRTSIVPHLRRLLPSNVILDWDSLMEPAGALAQSSIRDDEATWTPYRRLMKQVVEIADPCRVVMLGVCTPSELDDWPDGNWLVLDCSDGERRRRLLGRGETQEDIVSAVLDAAEYRKLGFDRLDATGWSPEQTAAAIAGRTGAA